MRSFQIKDKKIFTNALFLESVFDQFLMVEASFMTNQTYTIDGRILSDYYENDDEKATEAFTYWGQNRPICYQMIKGHRLPLYFKIVLTMNKSATEKIVMRSGCSENAADIKGLYLNITFREGVISCTTGISQSSFSMDKTLPDYWDRQIEGFFNSNNFD